ncbi:MAG: FAD-binding protein, partial [Candidatus Margulisiibacteriota bacterium]
MKYLRNELLKKHTSFKIGGPADYFCIPKNLGELIEALRFAQERKMAVAIMGGGTNLLALDKGFRGLV